MKEGEPVLGGPQANPGSTAPSNTFGPQPVGPVSGLPQMSTGNLASQPPAPIYGASQFSTFSNNSMATPQPNAPTLQTNTPTLQSNTTAPKSNIPTSQPNVAASLPFSQPQQPVMQSSAQPATHDDGDIILSSAQPQKNKKRFILPVSLFIIALVATIVAIFFVASNQSGQSNSGSVLAGNYHDAFNQYANYVLYGDESIDDILDKPSTGVYFAIWAASDNNDLHFFNKAKEFLDNFLKQKADSFDYIDNFFIEKYANTFNFYYLLNSSPGLTIDSVVEKYLQDGMDAASAYISSAYASFEDSPDPARTYGLIQKEIYLSAIEQVKVASESGCIEDGIMNWDCLSSFGTNFSEQRSGLVQNAQSIAYDASYDVVFDCYKLADVVYSSKEKQNDAE